MLIFSFSDCRPFTFEVSMVEVQYSGGSVMVWGGINWEARTFGSFVVNNIMPVPIAHTTRCK